MNIERYSDEIRHAERTPLLYRMSVEQYRTAITAGVYPPKLRAELLEGYVLQRLPTGSPHAYTLGCLTDFLYERVAGRFVIGSQAPVELSAFSRPEPDAYLARPPRSSYATTDPTPSDLVLVCEVAQSSINFDKGGKKETYAAGAVSEYWVLDVSARAVTVYTEPRPDGTFASEVDYVFGDTFEHD